MSHSASGTSEQRAPRVLLAICGGIAAYKSAELCRTFKKNGYDVRVVMTQGAQAFVQALTFQALSGNPVHSELLDPDAEAGMGHIELAKWPDLIVVAPATANFIAAYSAGLAGDLLNTLLLATTARVVIAPAMNQAMWAHPITQDNVGRLERLMDSKLSLLGPACGEQACGDQGPGRMLEPQEIADYVERLLKTSPVDGSLEDGRVDWSGKRVVITAGPTREAIDPVRFISNHSSGKMGYALAQACRDAGAETVLISGPVSLQAPQGVSVDAVESAEDMLRATEKQLSYGCDIFIATAAVADYRPAEVADQKLKKQGETGMSLTMVQNPDIVATVAKLPERPFVVGFAAETQSVVDYAQGKLQKKKLDMVIANDVSQSGIGFNSDDNEVQVVVKDKHWPLPKGSKQTIAKQIVAAVQTQLSSSK